MYQLRRASSATGILLAALIVGQAGTLCAQGVAANPNAGPPPLPPATKLEGFKPAAGSVVRFGYNELGRVGGFLGISVDVREMRDAHDAAVRGLVVEVRESEYREERSFVDADEIPELIKGLDALLDVTTNPTSFQNFEVRYTTRGELQLTAYNSSDGGMHYAVKAGRVVPAQKTGLNADDMRKLRAMFQSALDKLNTPTGKD